MKTRYKISLLLLLLPIITLIVSASLEELLGCEGGAGMVRCAHISDSIGGALFGISMVCAFGFPVAIFLALSVVITGFVIEKSNKR